MNAFIDCGAYNGDILKQVMESPKCAGKNFQFFAIECNPFFHDVEYGENVHKMRCAAWVFSGELLLYVNGSNPMNRGSSVLEEKTTGGISVPLRVQCFDFSKWLGLCFKIEDYVIVKMNIEGAEYEVLQRCIDDSTINLIDELYIRWHWEKVGIEKERHDYLVKALKKTDVKIYSKYDKLLR